MNRMVYAWVAILVLAGCDAQPTVPQPVTAQNNVQKVKSPDGKIEGVIEGTPAPGSRFARLQIGMGQRQAEELVGPPTDTDSHITGKQFIPFYFGGDSHRVVGFYRNQGRLEFAPSHFAGTANRLVKIVHNPAESGYAH